MKRVFFILIVTVILLIAAVASAGAHGNTAPDLADAGWTCFNVPGLGVHCIPPGTDAASAPPSISVKVFDTDDITDHDGEFLGTEILIRADIYERGNHNAPCPQEHLEEYFFLGEDMPYYACHHYSHDH